MNTYIALENIRSLYNVGAILRTCNFFGYTKIILLGYSGVMVLPNGKKALHPRLLKASLGAEKDLDIIYLDTSEELLNFCKKNECSLVSVEQAPGSIFLNDYKPSGDCVLVFGNEVTGVSNKILENSSKILEIPKKGTHNSLNVTTACGVVLQHLDSITS